MNKKTKLIFVIAYLISIGVMVIRYFLKHDPSTISGLILALVFQFAIFLLIYFGSQKKFIFKTTTSNSYPKRTKEKLPLKAFLICSLAFCGFKIFEQSFYIIYPNKISVHTNYQTFLDHLTGSAPTIWGSCVEIIIGSVSMIGIFFIWKMKKLGFYLYLIGESCFLFSFASQMISLNAGLLDVIVVGWEMMWPVWDIVFVIICAKKLKDMTWELIPLSLNKGATS